jgi:hypothetical protein
VGEDAECKDLCTFVNVFFPHPSPPSLSISLQKRNNQNSLFVGISFASKKLVWALQGRVYRMNYDVWPCFRV